MTKSVIYYLQAAVFICSKLIAGDRLGAHSRLLHDLLRDYDNRIRPYPTAANVSLPVTFSMFLTQILDVDEKNQIISTFQWNLQAWNDRRLKWNPDLYDDLEQIELPDTAIWFPDIGLHDNVDIEFSQSGFFTTMVNISHDGSVEWTYRVSYRSACDINVKYFPFDTQNCSLRYGFWMQSSKDVDLVGYDVAFNENFYRENSEFKLINVTSQLVHGWHHEPDLPNVVYNIIIKRRPMFAIFNLICPSFFIAMVAMLSFCIPPESGEKLGLGITVLLSLTVFLLIVSEQMPPNANEIPLIAAYYFGMILLVSLSTASSIASLNLSYRGASHQELPSWVRRACLRITSDVDQRNIAQGTSINSIAPNSNDHGGNVSSLNTNLIRTIETAFPLNDQEKSSIVNNNETQNHILQALRIITQSICRYEERLAEDARKETITEEWKQVARSVDKVLLCIFITVNLSVALGILFQAFLSG